MAAASADGETAGRMVFAGQPRGLSTLFFTELWERFSYYGMRALLTLFVVTPVATGGLGLSTVEAARVYGNYTMSVYLLSIPGGYIADRYLGAHRSVLIGGSIIAHGLYEFGISGPEHVIDAAAHWAEQAFPAIAGLAGWLATALVDFIIGLALGALLIPVAGYAISPAWGAVKRLVPKRA